MDNAVDKGGAAPSGCWLEVSHEDHLFDITCTALAEGSLAHATVRPVSRVIRKDKKELAESFRVLGMLTSREELPP